MKFYSDIFGWKMNDLGPQMNNYVLAQTAETDAQQMVQDKGAINGALTPRGGNYKATNIVIGVQSIVDTVKKIEAAGGKQVTPKVSIPGGSWAQVSDLEGNIFGIIDQTDPMPWPK
jgi:predicted enzyme related to lactoylglutathione lyase